MVEPLKIAILQLTKLSRLKDADSYPAIFEMRFARSLAVHSDETMFESKVDISSYVNRFVNLTPIVLPAQNLPMDLGLRNKLLAEFIVGRVLGER